MVDFLIAFVFGILVGAPLGAVLMALVAAAWRDDY